jgi:predicted transcriptional regulator
MPTTTTTARLDHALLERLKRLATVLDVEQSRLIREFVRNGIQQKFLEYALDLYKRRKVTLARAAEIAGVSRSEIMEAYDGVIDYSEKQLSSDLKGL